MKKRQWADKYGARWYLYRDGRPPHDDFNDYEWDGFQWVFMEEEADWYDQSHGQS